MKKNKVVLVFKANKFNKTFLIHEENGVELMVFKFESCLHNLEGISFYYVLGLISQKTFDVLFDEIISYFKEFTEDSFRYDGVEEFKNNINTYLASLSNSRVLVDLIPFYENKEISFAYLLRLDSFVGIFLNTSAATEYFLRMIEINKLIDQGQLNVFLEVLSGCNKNLILTK